MKTDAYTRFSCRGAGHIENNLNTGTRLRQVCLCFNDAIGQPYPAMRSLREIRP